PAPGIVDHEVADPHDPTRVRAAARALARRHPVDGVLTWDEFATVGAAEAARALGLPGPRPEAVATCRDKAAARARFDARQVPSTPWARVTTAEQAGEAARRIGFPVVLKPAAAGGSFGVRKVDTARELAAAHAFAAEAAGRGREDAGLLVESYLSGPEVSVEVASDHGRHHVLALTHKSLGAEPYFEETGHLVHGLPDPGEPAVRVALAALDAVGLTHGVSHIELRLTPDGPRVIEINPRPGGDLIPHLVRLATGVDVVAAAADLSAGLSPDLTPTRDISAGVRFLYPSTAGRLTRLDIDPRLGEVAWCERAVATRTPGDEVSPPPGDGLHSRLAHVVATAPTPELCRERLDRAAGSVRATITPTRSGR
ncbi:ATP-grasp domain-containing protein, partial [Streptomyces alkaliphilus]|uniref:ATP-grasp domain-containing protein n=1 Tax=Streptomyces alkaliphilus TaxID=1472722 RepID=UPI00117F4C85